MKNLQKDMCGPDGGLQKFKQPPDLTTCGLHFGASFHKQLRRRRSRNGRFEKPQIDNARRLRGMYAIDPEDGEYKETFLKTSEEKVGDYCEGGNALQNGNKETLEGAAGNRNRR